MQSETPFIACEVYFHHRPIILRARDPGILYPALLQPYGARLLAAHKPA